MDFVRPAHRDKGSLHGITVVVDAGDELWVGRCDEVTEEGVVLRDADVHRDAAGREAYLQKAVQVGHWPRVPHTVVPSARVVSIQKLDDLSVD